MKIAIITAMQSEYDAVFSLYPFKGDKKMAETMAYNKHILLIKSGIGKVNAAVAVQKAINEGADLIINTGLSGGIDQSLDQGDIVLADKVCYHDVWCGDPNQIGQVQDLPLYFEAPQKIISLIHKLLPSYKIGLTVTGDQFLTDVNRLKEIKKEFPAALDTDMESAAVAHVCYLNQKPYLSLRIISDVVGKEGQVEQFNTFFQKVPTKASEMVDAVLKAIPTDEILF